MMPSHPPIGMAASSRTIGKHRLVAGLGTGGMARVYLALAQKTGGFTKLLVLKVLRTELDADGDFLSMFMQEARLAARLNHPNVVQTYEVGEDAQRHFIAMEYLEGQALSSVLTRVGRQNFPLDVHLRILCDALEGLHYAHELADYDGTPLHIVHRDVSPQNVFVTYTGQSKILDFGIAKVAGSTRTVTGVLKGKVGYMAPEQATGKPDRRADLFAIGVMLWEAIAKRRFIGRGEDDVVVLTRRIGGNDRPIREEVPDAPTELAEICDKALATEPELRFATAADMRSALEAYLRKGEPVDARSVAALLETNYADERARIRGLIDDQVKRADDTGPMIDIHTHATVTPPTLELGVDIPIEVAATQVTNSSGAPRKSSVVLLVGLAVVILAVGGMVVVRRTQAAAPRESAPPATAMVSALPSTAVLPVPTAEAVPVTISVAIRTSPAGATLQLDGETVSNPFRLEVPKDGSHHTVVSAARGYNAETTSVTYDAARDIIVTLKPATMAVPARPANTNDVDLSSLKTKRPKRTVDEKDPYQ